MYDIYERILYISFYIIHIDVKMLICGYNVEFD